MTPDMYESSEGFGGGEVSGGFSSLWGPGSAPVVEEVPESTVVQGTPLPIDVPHFKFPFRLATNGKRVQVVEQDSDDEVLDCVEVTLRTRPGDRLDEPEFGMDDQAFLQYQDGNTDAITTAVKIWEPRARTYVAAQSIDDLVERVRLHFVEGGRGRVHL